MCGFAHSSFVTEPWSVTVLFASNSAAKEWWATTGLTNASATTTARIGPFMSINAPPGPFCTPKKPRPQPRRPNSMQGDPFRGRPACSTARLPDENFAAARDRGVASVTLIAALLVVVRQRAAERGEPPRVQAQERRVVGRREREGRQERDRLQRDDGAAVHPGAGAQLRAVAQHDRAALHLQAGEIAHHAADDDGPALHAHADLEPGGAVDDDDAVGHARRRAAVRGA